MLLYQQFWKFIVNRNEKSAEQTLCTAVHWLVASWDDHSRKTINKVEEPLQTRLLSFIFIFRLYTKPSGKLRRLTPSFGCTLAIRPKNIFFRNKTFLFFKIESWNFQVQFEIKIRETSQNFNSYSLFGQLLFSSFLSVVWLSWM